MKLYVDEKELGICKNELQNHHFAAVSTEYSYHPLSLTRNTTQTR